MQYILRWMMILALVLLGQASISIEAQNATNTNNLDLTIYPLSGDPGTTVTVIGNGFPTNAEIGINFGSDGTVPAMSIQRVTDENGAFLQEFTIPADYDVQNNRWRVTATVLLGGDDAASDLFTVTSDSTSPPSNTPTFTETRIYLVDSNPAAPQCGETITPVTISINETVAPLTAGLNRLFGYQAPGNAGDASPRNEFWRSPDLRVQSIDIDNRVAKINLTGTLNELGICSDAYMPAQIRQTALQFRTIDAVEIYYKGQSLQGYLSNNSTTPPNNGSSQPTFEEVQFFLVQKPFNETNICQEPLRPTTTQVPETVAPLSAALEAMFQGPQEVGNLYNAFGTRETDVFVDDIDIENGVATINITGRLVPVGNCDTRWMPEQIRQTALQFSTIDAVEIYYNGQNLRDFLAQGGA